MKSKKNKHTNESREIIDDIRRLVQAIRIASSDSEKRVGLSAAQLFVLNKLDEEKGLSINDLAERTLTHQSSVSVIVQKLEMKGLIKRETSDLDARKMHVSLTKKGARLIKRSPRSVQEQMIKGLEKMKPAMRHQFSHTFTVFLRAAGIKGDAPMMFDDGAAKKRKK
jgi:DNA-binding MarR family transcriptional regulator